MENANRIDGLKMTVPDTGAEPEFKTEIRWFAGPEGIAAHFICYQDAAKFPRRAPRQQRDNLGGADRLNVMLDFNGDGQSGYSLTLSRANSIEDDTISNENVFNADWDGFWYHAVRELPNNAGWQAELLIPWSSALMRDARTTRTIGLYVDRVIGSADLRAAKPNISFFKPQFLSLFERHEVGVYSQSLLKSYPYITLQSDLKIRTNRFVRALTYFGSQVRVFS
ncbi:hypothetical protein HC761_00545 [bacterium]|nr:hypothetical protein [bacterium]